MKKKILIIGVSIIIVILLLICIKLHHNNTGSAENSLPVQYSNSKEEIEENQQDVEKKIEQISRGFRVYRKYRYV